MNILSEGYVDAGFYRMMGKQKKHPLESSLEINTNSKICKITGYWYRQSGMPKQPIDVSIKVTDSEEIKSVIVHYFNKELHGTILSVNDNITGFLTIKKS